MIVLALFLTIILYLTFPLIYVMVKGGVDRKKANKLALINSIVCALFCIILGIIIDEPTTGGVSAGPAFLYFFIARSILSHKYEETDEEVKVNYSFKMEDLTQKFDFQLNQTYKLEELKKFLQTATAYAQHICSIEIATSIKEEMRESVFDPRLHAQTPKGEEPLLSFLFENLAKAYIEKEYEGIEKTIKPISKVKFQKEPKSCILIFDNPDIGESKALTYAFIPPNNIIVVSAIRIDKNKFAMLSIHPDQTFKVSSIYDSEEDIFKPQKNTQDIEPQELFHDEQKANNSSQNKKKALTEAFAKSVIAMEKSQSHARDDAFIGFMGIKMDENIFYEMMQKSQPWFTETLTSSLPPLDLKKIENNEELTFSEGLQYFFGLIFNAYGVKKNLTKAKSLCMQLLKNVERDKPTEMQFRENQAWMNWQNQYGSLQILLGTIHVYRHEYVKAAYHFMQGLKTEMVGLSMPYCDFIRYALSKINFEDAIVEHREGLGYSADEYMGCKTEEKNVWLYAALAPKVIGDMESERGEIILYHEGSFLTYGTLRRTGSCHSTTAENCIDRYETYVIDKDYQLKKIYFYFNGYLSNKRENTEILVAEGYHIKPHSKLWNYYCFEKDVRVFPMDD